MHVQVVKQRLNGLEVISAERNSVFATRAAVQKARLNLPLLPTTIIGSFPQTADIRASRAAFKKGNIDAQTYNAQIQSHIEFAVKQQELLGLDVLVHGEAERNDMVEYFGEQLAAMCSAKMAGCKATAHAA